jgi:hypothetical protein
VKNGCYVVDDQRLGSQGQISSLARVHESRADEEGREHDQVCGLLIWNMVGATSTTRTYCFVPIDPGHPSHVDDEVEGTAVFVTADGPIHLRWPSQEDFNSFAGGAPEGIAWPSLATDEERQAFLELLMYRGQM